MSREPNSARSVHQVTTQEITTLNGEVQDLLAERIPCSFPVAVTWPMFATAMLARIGGIVDAVTTLVQRRRLADAEVALRTLYEHVTVLCWLGIEPESHLTEWRSNSEARWGIFYREARDRYGHEVISEEEAAGLRTNRMKPIDQLADAVDEYWPGHIPAFRTGEEQPLLTFRGCYTAIFRPASRMAHAEVDTLQPYVNVRPSEIVITTNEREQFGRAGFAFPLFAFALLVYQHHFEWPDERRAKQITEALLFEPSSQTRG